MRRTLAALLIVMPTALWARAPAAEPNRSTVVRIDGAKFQINGQPTYKGRTWKVHSIEGLLFNSRMVQAIFDDRNPAIGQLKDDAIVLAYAVAGNYDETGLHFKGGRTDRLFDGVYLTYSRDNGRTWSRPVRDPVIHKFYDGKGLVSPYGKIVQLPRCVMQGWRLDGMRPTSFSPSTPDCPSARGRNR